LDLAFLQDAKQADLCLRWHLADLIEEQRAAVTGLEAARTVRRRSGERPLRVAKQLRVEQIAGYRAAVHRAPGLFGAQAGSVDRASE
jgi:hypothetical protein